MERMPVVGVFYSKDKCELCVKLCLQ